MAWTKGEKVGGYVLDTQLGQGGMATVYLGHHPELNRDVAIKVMHQNFLEDEGFVARFKREAQIVARLTHPHIVPVYDFSEHANQPYLVMKYIQGWTLKKQLIKAPPDLMGIVDLMSAVCDAVTYAHQQGILHRDIKPSNIVIDREGVPYLTDFGLARLVSSGESTMSADMLLGTPHYISPEQARGLSDLDGRTDIYSLGVILYELLVGKVPFTGDSAFSIIHDHIYTDLPAPTRVNPELPQSVETVLYKALAKQPQDRYATANEMMDDLRTAIKQGHLTALDPERAATAEASLAKIRVETAYDDQPTLTTAVGIGSPVPQGSSIRTATVYSKQAAFYDQPRFWFISGCGSLLVLTFISFGILLGISSNLQELTALSLNRQAFVEERLELFSGVVNTIAATNTSGIEFEREEGIPILMIPSIPQDELPDIDDNFIAPLVIARHAYETQEAADARDMMIANIPSNETERIVYLLSAARLADMQDDAVAAVIFGLLSTELSPPQPFIGDGVQIIATEIIYANAATVDATNLISTLRSLRDAELIPEDLLTRLEASDFIRFATIRNLIANDNVRLARNALERIPDDVQLPVAFDLLMVDLALLTGDMQATESAVDDILDKNDTPDWIRDRAEDIQTVLD